MLGIDLLEKQLESLSELDRQIFREAIASLERGRAVRRLDVILPALFLAAVIAVLIATGVSDVLVIAVTVIASALCVIWAMMSVSASLNAQFDVLTVIFKYYAESERHRRNDVRPDSSADAGA